MNDLALQAMTYASTTTLNRISEASPCKTGWRKLLTHLGKTAADDEPLDLLTVLVSNGFDDALWVLSFAMPDDRLARHFQAWCADQVLHLFEAKFPEDTRVRDQIATLRNDAASPEQRKAARAAAGAAARVAGAAWEAAWAAGAAARAAGAAGAAGAARTAAWSAQERQLRNMIGGASNPTNGAA